jgi:hypothetical protein
MIRWLPLFGLLPIGGIGWWVLGFPPGWGWIVLPMFPPMPVNFGEVVVLATVVVACYGGLVWFRGHF